MRKVTNQIKLHAKRLQRRPSAEWYNGKIRFASKWEQEALHREEWGDAIKAFVLPWEKMQTVDDDDDDDDDDDVYDDGDDDSGGDGGDGGGGSGGVGNDDGNFPGHIFILCFALVLHMFCLFHSAPLSNTVFLSFS